jgi:arginine/lysine/ornithine decarboxylase
LAYIAHPPTHTNSKDKSGSQQATATNTQAIIFNRHTSHARDHQLCQKSVEKFSRVVRLTQSASTQKPTFASTTSNIRRSEKETALEIVYKSVLKP